MNKKEAFKKVRRSYMCELFEKTTTGWRKYSKGFGNSLEVEDVDDDDVDEEVRAEHLATDAGLIYHESFRTEAVEGERMVPDVMRIFTTRPEPQPIVVIRRDRSENQVADTIGALMGAGLKAFFKK